MSSGNESIIARCDYCGCVLKSRAQRSRASLATREQQRAIIEEAYAAKDWASIRPRLAAHGHRVFWTIAFTCPGCGMRGDRFTPEHTQPEAEAVAAVQNRAAETARAAQEAAGWSHEVRRRLLRDARHFADLLLSRFPEWERHLQFVDPDPTLGPEGEVISEWDCALVAKIPSENPRVDAALEVKLFCREVRPSWGDFWHCHVSARPGIEGDNTEHLSQAVELLEAIVTERLLIGVCYRDGRPAGGGSLRLGAELPPWLTDPARSGDDRTVLRSWRGTYDRDIPGP